MADWNEAKNILAVRLDNLGDVLMTTPALRALRGSAGARRITLLTSACGAQVAPRVPEIDEAIVYDAPWLKATSPRTSSAPEREMAALLKARRFDGAVIFTVYSQNPLPAAFLCYLAEIPRRLAHCHENPYQLLTDWLPDPEPQHLVRHEVERQLDLVAAIGCHIADRRLSFRVPALARRRVLRLLERHRVGGTRPWLVIHPGASAPSRRYPPELFAAAAAMLMRRLKAQIVFTGDEAEQALIDGIRKKLPRASCSLAGELALAELGALIEMAPLIIVNNTGPAHIAAALGTPVVDLYALTNPQHTPWLVESRVLNHDVPCKYCYQSVCPEGHQACLAQVPPEAVFAAACELLAQSREAAPRAAIG
jgi:lipopolysaccharide heptosyltransferase II